MPCRIQNCCSFLKPAAQDVAHLWYYLGVRERLPTEIGLSNKRRNVFSTMYTVQYVLTQLDECCASHIWHGVEFSTDSRLNCCMSCCADGRVSELRGAEAGNL